MRRNRYILFDWCLIVLGGLLATQTACVRKRVTILSTPPGAQVFIDNREIGTTPVSTSYVYYATRSIRLQKDGYESLTVQRSFDPPWYEYPPLDLFSESFVPLELRDDRVVEFQLIPLQKVPAETIRERADTLRSQARSGHIVPLTVPPAGSPAWSAQPELNTGLFLDAPLAGRPSGGVPGAGNSPSTGPAALPGDPLLRWGARNKF